MVIMHRIDVQLEVEEEKYKQSVLSIRFRVKATKNVTLGKG